MCPTHIAQHPAYVLYIRQQSKFGWLRGLRLQSNQDTQIYNSWRVVTFNSGARTASSPPPHLPVVFLPPWSPPLAWALAVECHVNIGKRPQTHTVPIGTDKQPQTVVILQEDESKLCSSDSNTALTFANLLQEYCFRSTVPALRFPCISFLFNRVSSLRERTMRCTLVYSTGSEHGLLHTQITSCHVS